MDFIMPRFTSVFIFRPTWREQSPQKTFQNRHGVPEPSARRQIISFLKTLRLKTSIKNRLVNCTQKGYVRTQYEYKQFKTHSSDSVVRQDTTGFADAFFYATGTVILSPADCTHGPDRPGRNATGIGTLGGGRPAGTDTARKSG